MAPAWPPAEPAMEPPCCHALIFFAGIADFSYNFSME